jgi:CRISPR-associated protein Cas2
LTIFILDRAPARIHGLLSRWTISPTRNVYIGQLSARVRELLWERLCRELPEGATCLLLSSAPTEQGYTIRMHGQAKLAAKDYDGLQLMTKLR